VELIAEAARSDVLVVGSGIAGLSAAVHLARDGADVAVVDSAACLGGRCWQRRVLAVQDPAPLDELSVPWRRSDADCVCTVLAVDLAIGLLDAARRTEVCLINSAEVCDLLVRDELVRGLMITGTPGGVESAPGPCLAARATVDATGHDATLVGVLRRKLKDFYPGDVGESFVDAESASQRLLERTGEVYPGLYVAGMSAAAVYHLPRAGILVDGLLASGKRTAELIADDLNERQEPE
jgi:thiamine thiazole synthase